MESDFPKVGYKQMGLTGEKVSELGLGTYGINDYGRGEEAFLYAIERGVNLIDTAEVYHTEDFVGRVISKVGRENLFITTKVAPKNLASRESTIRSATGSLHKLGISSVDLILIHWPHNSMSIADQVKNIEAVQKEGLARFIGVSNFTVGQMEEAKSATSSAEIVCNQVKYNLEERGIEKDVIPFCEKHGISIVAYTPINKGDSSKVVGLGEVSKKTGRTPIQVSLNFLMMRQNVIPIPKTESLQHMKEILGSTGWKLDDRDVYSLSR